MTRAQARKVVVDNAKKKWMDDSWNVAMAGQYEDVLYFQCWTDEYIAKAAAVKNGVTELYSGSGKVKVWVFSRKDLVAKGLL